MTLDRPDHSRSLTTDSIGVLVNAVECEIEKGAPKAHA